MEGGQEQERNFRAVHGESGPKAPLAISLQFTPDLWPL